MKKFKFIYICVFTLVIFTMAMLNFANSAFSAEEDEEKLLNRLKGELAEEDSDY